jgi:hypothetical protein
VPATLKVHKLCLAELKARGKALTNC